VRTTCGEPIKNLPISSKRMTRDAVQAARVTSSELSWTQDFLSPVDGSLYRRALLPLLDRL
jgi:hypothetical protein